MRCGGAVPTCTQPLRPKASPPTARTGRPPCATGAHAPAPARKVSPRAWCRLRDARARRRPPVLLGSLLRYTPDAIVDQPVVVVARSNQDRSRDLYAHTGQLEQSGRPLLDQHGKFLIEGIDLLLEE